MSVEEYLNARRSGERAFRRAQFENRDPYLGCLDLLLKDRKTVGESRVAIMEIPLSMVVGTVTDGRRRTFADNFMPIMEKDCEFARKWSSLYDIQEEEGIRDAVKVYEYMHRFYVQEGNKRVSVLKYLDVPSISADVTRILPERTDDKEVQCYYEFLEFFKVAPFYDIEFSKPGAYLKFASLIGRDLEEPWPADLINVVRGAYFRFASVYSSRAGRKMSITTGDAFLMYLMIYQFDSLLDYSRDSIAKRLEGIWNELLVENNGQEIVLQENPGPDMNQSFLAGLLNRPLMFTEKHPMKAAFLYEKSLGISGWASDHDIGRIAMEHYYEGLIHTWYYENCNDDEKIQNAIEDAVAKGADVIFTTTASAMTVTIREAVKYPKVRFANCSVLLPSNAVRTYNMREYEVKFLMGVLAAVYSENHKVGYLATRPSYGVLSGINAFAVGAGMIDPEIKVYLGWEGLKEFDWKRMLNEHEISVYAGLDLTFDGGDCPDYGLVKTDQNGNIIHLASPIRNWTRYYERIARSILDGSWDNVRKPRKDQALNEWWGLSAGVIDINLSDSLSYYSARLIEVFRNGIVSGALDPFSGELHSQQSLIQPAGSNRMESSEIIRMNWLNDNVIGRIPLFDELSMHSQKQLEGDGVIKGVRV
ncbi:MAG: BMP family ABC transporter substrate-binding protein [Erysipelotrichia bacterium]|nr:BMP family ABC transporter substrate-binding protein [Erysipelotrichia bacterium]